MLITGNTVALADPQPVDSNLAALNLLDPRNALDRDTAFHESRESTSLFDSAIHTVNDPFLDLGRVPTKPTILEDIQAASRTAEESVASRFGDADLAREQIERTKLQLFSQLATTQTRAIGN